MFFHALTSAGTRESSLNTRLQGQVFKLHLRDLANVNALKQMCDRYSCTSYNSMKTPSNTAEKS